MRHLSASRFHHIFAPVVLLLFALHALSLSAQTLSYYKGTNGLFGYMDEYMSPVIAPKYEEALQFFSEDLAAVKLNGKWGYIDKNANFVVPAKYDGAGSFSEGLAAVSVNGKWGFIDKSGNFVIPTKYEWTSDFCEGLTAVKLNGKWGYIDKTGKSVIPTKFEKAWAFSEGLAAVTVNGKRGYIDKSGNLVITPRYEKAGAFSDGMAGVVLNGKWGFIDKNGTLVVPAIYDVSYKSSDGLAAVKLNGKWGFVDKTGKLVIPTKYDSVWSFYKGIATVKKGTAQLYIDRDGNEYNSVEQGYAALNGISNMPFADYIALNLGSYDDFLRKKGITPLTEASLTAQVQAEVERWQVKGEFENTPMWQQRVNETTRAAKASEVATRITDAYNSKVQRANDEYKAAYDKLAKAYCDHKARKFAEQTMSLKPYDADNCTFLISTSETGDILLPVPLDKAAAFKANWPTIKASATAVYVPVGKDVALQSVRFGDYVYDSNTKADYAMTAVDYNFRPIDLSNVNYNFTPLASADNGGTTIVTNPGNTLKPKTVTPEERRVQGGSLADVDVNIPQGTGSADNTFAVIIANGKYEHASPVANAINDGETMAKYLTRTLGIPAEQVKTYTDATYGSMASAVAYLGDIAQAYHNEPFNVIFYYVGHGLPDDNSKEAYMLPVDVDPRITSVCYPLNKLYKELAALNAANVTVIIDACFSGSNYGDGMLVADARGAVIKAKEAAPTGNMVVLTAAQAGQTAFPYKDKSHGMFTYYILKKLQDSRGKVSLGELSDYVIDRVSKKSVSLNSKPQTPTVAVSPTLSGTWRELPFGGR